MGWPSAIAPPFGFVLAPSSSSPRDTAIACAANASLLSMTSIWSMVKPPYLKREFRSRDRSLAHDLVGYSGHRIRYETRQGPVLGGRGYRRVGQDEEGGTIVDARGVARGHRTV